MSELELRGIRSDEKGALIEVLCAAFPDDPAATWRRVVDGFWGDFEHTRVGVLDGQIVSTVQIFRYPMRIDDQVFEAGAIAHVATRPEIKGAMYAGRVLRDAIDVMKREGLTLSILVTDIPRYYNRYGWWVVPERGFRIGISAGADKVASSCRIKQLDLARDYDAAAGLHERAGQSLNGTTPRTRQMWFTSPPWEPDDPARSVVARRGGEIVGYARGRGGSLRIVSEMACRSADVGAALLDHLIEAARAGGEQVLRGKFPLDEAIADVVRARGHRVDVDFPCGPDEDFEITMVGFLDLPGFFQEFEGVLQRRAREAGYEGDGAVEVTCRAGEVTLQSKGGRISTAAIAPEGVEKVRIKDAALVGLVCGTVGAREMDLPDGISERSNELLAAVSAKRDFVMWLPDHF